MNYRTVITALLAALAFASTASPARAVINTVTIANRSDRCAWVTVYWSSGTLTPFTIADHNAQVRPRFLRPGETHRFPTGNVAEMKIRAEVKQNADCSGGTIHDTYDVRKSGSAAELDLYAHLMKTGNGYNLWFY